MPIRNLTDDEAAEFDARHNLRGLKAQWVAKQANADRAASDADAARSAYQGALNDLKRVYGDH